MTFFTQKFFITQAIKRKLASLSKVPRLFVALFIILLSLHIFACAENDKKTPYLTEQEKTENIIAQAKQKVVEDALKISQEYAREVKSSGFTQVLTADFLTSDTDYTKSQNLFTQARLLITKYEQKIRDYIFSMFSKMLQLDISPSYKNFIRDELSNFNQIFANSNAGKFYRLEKQAVDELEKTSKFLHNNRDKWSGTQGGEFTLKSADNKFYFKEEDARLTYHNQLTKIIAIAQQQQNLQ